MKKAYDKPYAQKVAFSYQDQVVAVSGGTGNINNRDNTAKCQFMTYGGCNKYWTPAGASQAALFSLTDCAEAPSD